MKEIRGQLWDYFERPSHIVCITTNLSIRKDGAGVMGRGCAREANLKLPGLSKLLGHHLRTSRDSGKPFFLLPLRLIAFPVKYRWYDDASLELIAQSACWLDEQAKLTPHFNYVLPRPGCGNGRLDWNKVKPILAGLPDNVLVITYER